MSTTKPAPLLMRLPHGETDASKRYSMPDPDVLAVAYEAAYGAVHYDGEHEALPTVTLDRATAQRLLMLAGGYLDLTTYTLGQERCTGKLRDIWRARRARRSET